MFIGIDPGKQGAIACLDDKKITITATIDDIPTIGKLYDINGVYEILKKATALEISFCVIEKQQVMPKQGSVSGFTIGFGYGILIGILKALEIPFQEVRPSVWKKTFSLTKDKSKSITTAQSLFPNLADQFVTKRGRALDGRAEAILLAEYAKRIYRTG